MIFKLIILWPIDTVIKHMLVNNFADSHFNHTYLSPHTVNTKKHETANNLLWLEQILT